MLENKVYATPTEIYYLFKYLDKNSDNKISYVEYYILIYIYIYKFIKKEKKISYWYLFSIFLHVFYLNVPYYYLKL